MIESYKSELFSLGLKLSFQILEIFGNHRLT